MTIKFIFILSLTTTLCVAQQTVNIIPQPVSIQQKSGNFILTGNTAIQYNPQQKDLKKVVDFFNLQIRKIAGFVLYVNISRPTTIQLTIEKLETTGDEDYRMEITSKGVAIKANTTAGIIYGIQSLLQTLPPIRTNAKLEIPCMNITDYPRFKYRGMHLDVARHFMPVDFVKRFIELLSRYKYSYFHWHLTLSLIHISEPTRPY